MPVMTVARLGVARLGAFRLDAFVQPSHPTLKGAAKATILINGVNYSVATGGVGVFVDGLTVTDELNHQPNTCTFRCRGFTPLKGQEVKIYLGDTDVSHQLFGGRILSLEQGVEGKDAAPNVYWECHCIDYTWLLNRRMVITQYTNQSATAIVLDLVATFTSGITTVHVAADLPVIDAITFTNDELTDALTRLTERIGGYWYIDYAKDLHFFVTEAETAGAITDSEPRTARDLSQTIDLSQVATRIVARGGGSNAAADVPVGSTTLPVEEASWYLPGGGTVECGRQRIIYAGVAGTGETGSTTGHVVSPPATHSVQTVLGGAGGFLDPSAVYGYAFTWVTDAGETPPGPTAFGNSGVDKQVDVLNPPTTTDPAVTAKNLYRTEGGGAVLKLESTYTPTDAGPIFDADPDSSLGAVAPTVNTAGSSGAEYVAGSTSLPVADTSVFPASGWAMAPGDQLFSYTGRTTSSGSGSLTGIPASGPGSLTSAVRSGTVKVVPHLTGIAASGFGAIRFAIAKGDQVNVAIAVDDGPSQSTMATTVGGDGIHEYFISDGRWGIVEAIARANTELALRKDPLVTVHLETRDQTVVAGRNLTITKTHPAISGTFKIQRVTITQIGIFHPPLTFPLRTVELSSKMYSFEDLLKTMKRMAE
jgi:hypothetical protein